MYKTSDWVRAISKLIELTVKGSLDWDLTSHPDDTLEDSYSRTGRCFTASYKGKRYRVFEVRYKKHIEEFDFVWDTQYELDILNWNRTLLARAPKLDVTKELFQVVEQRFVNEEDALEDLLGETNEDDSTFSP